MELLARLENIAFYVKQLKTKCDELEQKNTQLIAQVEYLQAEIKAREVEIQNLEETKKISKLAEGVTNSHEKEELRNQIDSIIREIDNCLVLVKI